MCLYTLLCWLIVGWNVTDWSCVIEQSMFLVSSSLEETSMHTCERDLGRGSYNIYSTNTWLHHFLRQIVEKTEILSQIWL